jgi:hypothetical protein
VQKSVGFNLKDKPFTVGSLSPLCVGDGAEVMRLVLTGSAEALEVVLASDRSACGVQQLAV